MTEKLREELKTIANSKKQQMAEREMKTLDRSQLNSTRRTMQRKSPAPPHKAALPYKVYERASADLHLELSSRAGALSGQADVQDDIKGEEDEDNYMKMLNRFERTDVQSELAAEPRFGSRGASYDRQAYTECSHPSLEDRRSRPRRCSWQKSRRHNTRQGEVRGTVCNFRLRWRPSSVLWLPARSPPSLDRNSSGE